MNTKETRGARRKRQTRQRMIDAALRLIAEKSLDGVAINEITDEADVGIGSFYNHFASKEALYDELLDEVFGKFGDAVDTQLEKLEDPAEMISIAIRYSMQRAKRNPEWAKFLIREGFSNSALPKGLGIRLTRDILTGIRSGRFKEADLMMQVLFISGAVMACMSVQLGLSNPNSPQSKMVELGSVETGELDERLAKKVLVILGIDPEEASTIACVPLPRSTLDEQP